MRPVSGHKGKQRLTHLVVKREHALFQVVKAKWRKNSTFTVDNVRGRLLDATGYPFLLFGSYTYGVSTELERAVPEMEVPFGVQ